MTLEKWAKIAIVFMVLSALGSSIVLMQCEGFYDLGRLAVLIVLVFGFGFLMLKK